MSADIHPTQWKLVEVGRVILFQAGEYAGRLAAIVEIIDHKRVLVDGPASKESAIVPRHAAHLSDLTLTPIVIAKLPRAAGNGVVRAAWNKAGVEKAFGSSILAQKRAQLARRRSLTDFERFKVMKLKKQIRYEEKKTFAKIRASANA